MNRTGVRQDRRILVYELMTGGGTFGEPRLLFGESAPAGSMLHEGLVMLTCLCQDLVCDAGVSLDVLWDSRIDSRPQFDAKVHLIGDQTQHDATWSRLLSEVNQVLIIAPETFGALSALVQRAESTDVTLLSPDSVFVRLAADKLATVRRLNDAGIPVPTTRMVDRETICSLESRAAWIVKPNDSCGSDGVWRMIDGNVAPLFEEGGPFAENVDSDRPWIAQHWVDGRVASVSALCGRGGFQLLSPMWQEVDPITFEYRGGRMIEEPDVARRARSLARSVLRALPTTIGYVGVDLVLGAQPEMDRVLEVNPRLTSSYLGLSRAANQNLAAAMVRQTLGDPVQLTFDNKRSAFNVLEASS